MAIWRMRIACWIPKATDTLSLCNINCFFTTTMVARTPLNVTLYVHCLSYFVLTLHAVRVPPSLGDTTCACNFLSVTETVLQSIMPKSVKTFIVSNILNVFIVSNFGILPSCPTHLLWTLGHQGWYLYFILYLSYLCLIQVPYFI